MCALFKHTGMRSDFIFLRSISTLLRSFFNPISTLIIVALFFSLQFHLRSILSVTIIALFFAFQFHLRSMLTLTIIELFFALQFHFRSILTLITTAFFFVLQFHLRSFFYQTRSNLLRSFNTFPISL